MPSFAEHAQRGMRRHPEIFSALEEFERTGKVPKFRKRKHIDLTLDPDLIREFRTYCREKGLTMSGQVERYIRDAIRKQKP